MKTILSILIVLALTGPLAAELVTEEVVYEVDGQEFTGYLAYDDATAEKRPGVLVVHEWWGHNDYARKRAVMLAEMGYTAFALDMYGTGKQADHPEDAQKFAAELVGDLPGAERRFTAAYEILAGQSTVESEKMAAIGYCLGGGVILHMARIGMDLDGVVSFHGSLATQAPAAPGAVKARILVLDGEADPFSTAEVVAAFEEEMKAAGADYELIRYPGVKHSFTNPEADGFGEKFEMPLAYDKAADEDSWKRMSAFFDEIFE